MRWRLGIDLGTNSLGWAALSLDEKGAPERVISLGSRIFSDGRDPKSGASLAVDRRDARAMRRRRDRFKRRQAALLKHMTRLGLFPEDPAERKALETLDPYELRARVLSETLPLPHLGRALFHLDQRRGFKSNRKADRGKDDDQGKIAVAVGRLAEAMDEAAAETLGQFLHMRREKAEALRASGEEPGHEGWVRTRLRDAAVDGYDFYPSRAIVEEEFETILARQRPHHPDVLTDEAHDCLYEIIFHQRPLKAPKIGRCTLVSGEERLPKAHPLFQRRRLLEELNALEITLPGEKPARLTREQRDLLLLKLKGKRKVAFKSLRSALKLDPDARFNKESESRVDLKSDEVAAALGDPKRFGNVWAHLSPEAQWEVVSRLRELESDEDEAAFRSWLTERHGLSPDAARAVCGAPLPEGFGRIGETATRRLIEALEAEVIVYSEAVEKAGLGHHSDFRTDKGFVDDEGRPALPYYGAALERHILPGTADPDEEDEALRVGRLTNPTVHIGLNQLRKVVNDLIRAYGPPEEVAIELARELKLSDDEKIEHNKRNRKNREAAERRSKTLTENGIADTGANRARLALWEDLNPENVADRRCPYSGEMIGIRRLFAPGAVDVDHILPFTKTLDDSNANKTVCLVEANRMKRNRSPYEARADFEARWPDDGDWESIAGRAARMQKNKRWRFEPDAMDRFRDDPENGRGFIARQLIDTQHLSRLAREYLSALYPHRGEGSSHVWVSPGRLTEMVRRKLGLNDLLPDHNYGGGDQPKNRKDHRHHAIDAAVVAIVDRSLLQEIANASGKEGKDGREKIVIPEPWEGFRDELRRAVNDVVVSHRPDHGTVSKAGLKPGFDKTAGRLHNDTAYGLTGLKDARGNDLVVHRAPLSSLKKASDLDAIRDDELREALKGWTSGKEGKAFEQALRDFGDPLKGYMRDGRRASYPHIRRARLVEPLSVIPIRDGSGRAYKGYKGDSNHRYDVWELKDGAWKAEVVSTFDASQPGWTSAVRTDNPTAKKVLSLHRDDMLAIERPEGLRIARVVKFNQAGQLILAESNEAGSLKARDADKTDPFKYLYPSANTLKAWRARQVRVDPLGRVSDPGFPPRTAVRRTRPKT